MPSSISGDMYTTRPTTNWGRRMHYGTISNRVNERELYHDLVRAEGMGPHAAAFERYFVDVMGRSPSMSSRSDSDAFETMPYREDAHTTSADSEMMPIFDVQRYCSRNSKSSHACRAVTNTFLTLFAALIVYASAIFCICLYLAIIGVTLEVVAELEPGILGMAGVFLVMLFGMLLLQVLDYEHFRPALLNAFMITESAVFGIMSVIFVATGVMMLMYRILNG